MELRDCQVKKEEPKPRRKAERRQTNEKKRRIPAEEEEVDSENGEITGERNPVLRSTADSARGAEESVALRGEEVEEGPRRAGDAAEAGEEAGARDAQGAGGSLLHLPRAHQGARRHGVVLLPRLPRVVLGDARAPRQGRRHDAPLRRRDVPALSEARAGLPRRHASS